MRRILTRSFTYSLAACVGACAPEVAESPHASLLQLARAVQTGDTATTLRYVDLDAIAARLLRDVLATVRDSMRVAADDTLSADFRARIDSIQTEWREILRADLGLTTEPSFHDGSFEARRPELDEEEGPLDGHDGVLAEGAVIVGDGAVRFAGDTALVERFIRYAHLDTSVTLTIALVPVERAHWRVVALHNPVPVAAALQERQVAILKRANEPLRDTIRARVSIRDLTITREPLEEWDRYAAEVLAVVENRSFQSVVVYSAHIVGPRFSLADSVGEVLSQSVMVPAGEARRIAWRHPLRGDHAGPFDVVHRPQLYTIEIADVEFRGARPQRVQLYSTWREFIERNPLPGRSSGGVLARLSRRGLPELAAAAVRRHAYARGSSLDEQRPGTPASHIPSRERRPVRF